MFIKTRLLLSYIAMTVIPIVLFALIAGSISFLFFRDLGTDRQAPGSAWRLADERNELFAGVKYLAKLEPERLSDARFLARTDERMNELKASLVVKKGDDVLYASPPIGNIGNRLQLPANQQANPSLLDDRYLVDGFPVTFEDGVSGAVFMLTDSDLWAHRFRTVFPVLALSLLGAVALTNGVLTYLVSRSIIKPLHMLKRAAERMKEGDLDQAVDLRRKDEIGKLGSAFEEMRVRLQDSIRLQLQYEDNRKELISSISHDLKTPITGIQACLEGIRDGIADSGPKRDKYMDMIARKTEDMDRLIDELVLFSKLDLNRLPFQLEPVNLTAYLRDCAEELRLDPRLTDVAVALDVPGGEEVRVMADREKLRRMIMNVVDNSLKHLDKPRKAIELSLSAGPSEATVRIRDNGAGIDAAAQPHIFDRFYRADTSRNTATGGSGLGLAIVKQMAEGQGGKVWADSRIGEGTSISFTLPRIANKGVPT